MNCDDRSIQLNADETAQISIPFPSSYPSNIDISWVIRTVFGRKIFITYPNSVAIEGSYVFRAGDGTDGSMYQDVFFRWSSNSKRPPNLLSNGNSMWIRLEPTGKDLDADALFLASSVPVTETVMCPPLADIDCGHDVCITNAWQCDGQSDCPNGQDELNCDEDRIVYIPASETAVLRSTLYPDNYPHSLDITWVLTTEEDLKFLISVLDFETQRSGDYLRAGDGNNTDNGEFFVWHGSKQPPDLLSGGNQMWLRFTSNSYSSRDGFELSASSVPSTETLTCPPLADIDCGHDVCITNAWQCDGQSDCLNGQDELNCDKDRIVYIPASETAILRSTLYPDNYYPNNLDITWLLTTEEELKFLITFLEFETQRDGDYLRAGDGNNTANDEFFVWHGTKHPQDFLSDGNQMWLRFTSNGYSSRDGFHLSASSVPSNETLTCIPGDVDCGHSVCIPGAWQCDGQSDCLDGRDELNCDEDRVVYLSAGETGRIASTLYPENYPHNLTVTWILQTEESRKILLNFSAFDTENRLDFLQVGDGDSTAFFEWSWSKLPPELLSSGSTMWLRFISDESISRTGFLLSASSVQKENLTCSADELDCGHSVCIRSDWQCDHVPDCMDGSDESNCNYDVYLNADESVSIASPLYPSDYPNNFGMTLNIQTEEDRKILITFAGFETSGEDGVFRAGDGINGVNGSDVFFILSGDRQAPELLSDGNMMWISFESGKGTPSRGFSLSAASVPSTETLRCTLSEIDCGNVCVSGNGRCDGFSDCVDGRDETDCASCEGRCFLDGSRGGCFCDDVCESFGDCCSDFVVKCKAFLFFTTPLPAVNECNPPSHNCDVNAICTDTPSSFTCTCTSGFVGDGTTCADVQSPNITCPADLTVYTNCRKNYSRVLLPEADSVFDNSGVSYITIDVDGSAYDAFDTVNLDIWSSPHLVRYNATDESFNFAQCEMYIRVAALPDSSFCTSTANPPNCICLPAMGQGCTCSSGYCGHDCSQSSEGVECIGPAMPYPNCTDIDECDPGHSGPRCTSDAGKVQCPEVDNKCLGEGVSAAYVGWILSDDINQADIDCVDFAGNRSSLNATGGTFGTGDHDVICFSKTDAFPECLISFIVSAYPSLTVPAVDDQCTDPGMDTSTVTWTEVYATDAGEVTIDCTESGDGVGVGIAGGVFGVGNHTITCRAVNSAGCVTSEDFSFTVKKGNLLPFGPAIGDGLLSDVPQESFLPSKDLISPTIYPPDFFPFCDGLYQKLYFTDNGVIVLSNEQSLDKLGFPSAPSSVFTGNKAMITPFWADVKGDAFSPTSNVFWQAYDQYEGNVNQDMLDIISDTVSTRFSNFSANWALVVTWSNVRAISLSRETNTFQAVLATDGIRGFVIFNYDPCGTNWDFSFLLNKNVIQGFTCGTPDADPVYVVNVPGESLYHPGTTKGNVGQAGRWVFRLNTPRPDFVNPRQQCHNWHSRQPPYHSLGIYLDAFADTCPCSLVNARLDWRYIPIPAYNLPPELRSDFPAVCYVRLYQSPGAPGPQCCYNTFTGDLLYDVRSPRVASVLERFPFSPIFYTDDWYQQWLDEEVWPRYYCCEQSTLCHLYKQWRPLMDCKAYVPPAWLWLWGDPHVVTLDGLEYTFNGLGEYTLALIEDDDGQRVFQLQGRTRQAVDTETGELSQATVYSGFAAVYTGEARIEVKLSDDAMDLVTTVNGTVVTPTTQGLVFDNLRVTKTGNPIKVSVVYSDHVTFIVGVNNSMADITVLFNEDLKGKTKGIIGVWDDDPSNDVLKPDGSLQTGSGDNGVLVEIDYFEFGEAWRIEEEDSLFFYQSPAESYDSLNDPNFSPDFLQELIDKAPPGKYNEAKAVCGSSKTCLYDSLALNDTSIGMATLMLNEMNSINMVLSTNFPPNLTLVESIEVVVGQTFTLQLEATDPDGDNITYHLLSMVEGASISPDDGLFTWTPANRSKVSIGFQATDGKANAALEPIVKLCGCENAGACLFDQYVSGTNLVQDRFGVVLCECQSGWSGEFCDTDYDACADNPCFMGVACTDEAPPSYNSTCGPCPEGLEGDGKSCQDIDECELYKNQTASSGGLGCDHNCDNILMNYTCSCNPGYVLHDDDRQCIEAPSTMAPTSAADSTPTDQSETSTAAEEAPSTVAPMLASTTSGTSSAAEEAPSTVAPMLASTTDQLGTSSAEEAPSTVAPMLASTTDQLGTSSADEAPSTVAPVSSASASTSYQSDTSSADVPSTTPQRSTSTSGLTSKTTTGPADETTFTATCDITHIDGLNATFDDAYLDSTTEEYESLSLRIINAISLEFSVRYSVNQVTIVVVFKFAVNAIGVTLDITVVIVIDISDLLDLIRCALEKALIVIKNLLAQEQTTTPELTSTPELTITPEPTTTPIQSTAITSATTVDGPPTTAQTTTQEPTTTPNCQVISCLNGGTFDAEFCECVCPPTHSGVTCSDENLCLSGDRCPGVQSYCLPDLNQDGFTCSCSVFDGFFPQDDGSCRELPSKQIVLTVDLDFNQAFRNPSSSAFRRLAAVFERMIFMILNENPSTNGVSSVHVPWLQEGSVIIRSVASFENGAPSESTLQQVMSNSPSLIDGNTVINIINPDSIIVNDGEVVCVPTYCKNGGTCETSGNFPNVLFTCSCQASYTGERCETELEEPDDGGLSTVALVLIIVGLIVLITVVVCMLVCMCLLIQRQQAKALAYREDRQRSRVPRESRNAFDNYVDLSAEYGDVSRSVDAYDEGDRMNRLMHVMSRSPYLQQNLSGQEEFVRPYMVTGMEGPYHEDPPVNLAGRVVRNPMVN
ncbi:uncharacterized protein LOC119734296 isoform X2 [Patiria miniata]|uniref:Uncharacterized protein n=1 Tax=Patiria miniata TaxID=46514 RepID=A0A914AJ20_PATMI|nr:uncharacterized protein LOC119734296 isoform X2 [Patiria miniata]